MSEAVLDCSGEKCPLPVLRTRKALKAMAPGDVLLVTCTDPMAQIDIPALLRQTGDVLEASETGPQRAAFRIRKG